MVNGPCKKMCMDGMSFFWSPHTQLGWAHRFFFYHRYLIYTIWYLWLSFSGDLILFIFLLSSLCRDYYYSFLFFSFFSFFFFYFFFFYQLDGLTSRSLCNHTPYRCRPAKAQRLTAKALFRWSCIYPYFLTRLGSTRGTGFQTHSQVPKCDLRVTR